MKTFLKGSVAIIIMSMYCYWFASIQPLNGLAGVYIKSNPLLMIMYGAVTTAICLMIILMCLQPFMKGKEKK